MNIFLKVFNAKGSKESFQFYPINSVFTGIFKNIQFSFQKKNSTFNAKFRFWKVMTERWKILFLKI